MIMCNEISLGLILCECKSVYTHSIYEDPIFPSIQEAVSSKYGVPRDQLRVYIHYQPSYYHLHVHITRLSYAAPKTSVGQAHLLHDVISNIETIDPGYYQKCVLSFTAGESGPLWKAYKDHAARN